MGTGTVVGPTTCQRLATPPNTDSTTTITPSESKEVKPPAKRRRTQKPKPRPASTKLGRPKKIIPSPNDKGLPALPAEIIGRIASFLLPPDISVENGFLPPGELPYGGARSKSVQAKIKYFKYGGIPSGVRDVLNLARTCKRCDNGVGLIIGKIGDGCSDGNKRTMYITIPFEKVLDTDDVMYRDFDITQHRIEVSNTKEVWDRIKASSAVLERLVFHQCDHGQYDPNISALIDPFQHTSTTFPNLEFLQLGPNLCESCTCAILHLFVGKEFTRSREYQADTARMADEPELADETSFMKGRSPFWSPHGEKNRVSSYSLTAAPNDRHIDYEESAAPNLVSLQLFISETKSMNGHDSDILNRILRLIPPATSVRMFQLWLRENLRWNGMGTSGTVQAYVCKDVKVVEEELTEWAKKEKEKSMTVQERLLAKFQAEAAKVLPSKRKKDVVEVAEDESVDNKDDDEGDLPLEPDVKPDISESGADPKDDDLGSDSEMGTGSNGSKGPKMTHSERHAIYSHRWTVRQYTPILFSVARAMPDLIGLSVLRQGTYMAEITQGARSLETEVELWLEPISKLDKLQYLDLGLAVSGIKEVSDFPLGLSIAQSRKGRESAKVAGNDIQALKRRKYEQDIKKAIEEGDKWRLEVLKRFLIPKLVGAPVSLADAESASVSGDSSGSGNGDGEDAEGSLVTWPKGLTSGYIYSSDLVNRLRGNGLAIPWKVVGRTVQLGQPKKIKL